MAEFEFTHNGNTYKVEAEDDKSALAKFKGHVGNDSEIKFGSDNNKNKTWGEVLKGFGAERSPEEMKATGNELKAIVNKWGKSIPILGNYLSENEESKAYSKQHPVLSALVSAEGAVGSGLVASGGIAAIPGLSRGLPWLTSQVAGSAAIGGADKAAQQHSQGQDLNTSDILKAMGISGGASLAGATASKFISPNMGIQPPKTFVPKPPQGPSYEDILARTRWNNPANQKTQEQLAELINARRLENAKLAFEESTTHPLTAHAVKAAGSALGHASGTGGILSHLATSFHQNVLKNQYMNDPGRAALMQALLGSGAEGLNRITPITQ